MGTWYYNSNLSISQELRLDRWFRLKVQRTVLKFEDDHLDPASHPPNFPIHAHPQIREKPSPLNALQIHVRGGVMLGTRETNKRMRTTVTAFENVRRQTSCSSAGSVHQGLCLPRLKRSAVQCWQRCLHPPPPPPRDPCRHPCCCAASWCRTSHACRPLRVSRNWNTMGPGRRGVLGKGTGIWLR